jgi:hypothetical protein
MNQFTTAIPPAERAIIDERLAQLLRRVKTKELTNDEKEKQAKKPKKKLMRFSVINQCIQMC